MTLAAIYLPTRLSDDDAAALLRLWHALAASEARKAEQARAVGWQTP